MEIDLKEGEKPSPILADLMTEEKLMSKVISTEKLHKKCKILIYNHLE